MPLKKLEVACFVESGKVDCIWDDEHWGEDACWTFELYSDHRMVLWTRATPTTMISIVQHFTTQKNKMTYRHNAVMRGYSKKAKHVF
jgi:hypothetical protein